LVFRRVPAGERAGFDTQWAADVELSHFSGLSREDAVVGVGENLDPRHLWMALTRRDRIESNIRQMDDEGFFLSDIIPAALGLFETVRYYGLCKGRMIAAVEIGKGHGELVVCRDDRLVYARGLEGLPSPESEDDQEKLLTIIDAALDLYREKCGSENAPEAILLFTPASPPGFRARLHDRTGMASESFTFPGSNDPNASPTALGLALLLHRPVSRRMSLLPDETRRIVHAAARHRLWMLASVLLILAVVVAGIGLRLERARWLEQADAWRTASHTLEKGRKSLHQLVEDSARWQEAGRILVHVERDSVHAEAVLEAVSMAKHDADWITLISDSDTYFSSLVGVPPPLPPESHGTAQEGGGARYYVVQGYSPSADLGTVQAFISTLQAHPAVRRADLLGDDLVRGDTLPDTLWPGLRATPFAVEIEVMLP
jgi:hypothetical protein